MHPREDLDNPIAKSIRHHTLMKCAKTQHLSRTVTPPKPLPTEWDYKPPPIFFPPTCKLAIAVNLQQTLEFGLSFQLPQDSTATPFLTNFHACLTLETNNPPLTHFQTTQRHTRAYTEYRNLLTTQKHDLKTNGLAIVSADKGTWTDNTRTNYTHRHIQPLLYKNKTQSTNGPVQKHPTQTQTDNPTY